jgi:hypothetical protein
MERLYIASGYDLIQSVKAAWFLRMGSAVRGGEGGVRGESASYLQCGGCQRRPAGFGWERYGSGW